MKKGKPLEDYLSEVNEITAKTSEITRNLSLAGIGIIWIFRTPVIDVKLLDQNLKNSLILIVTSLIIDLFQYIFMSISIKIFHRVNEVKLLNSRLTESDANNLLYPTFLENLTWVFFIGKIIAMVLGYYYIYTYLFI